ncbi:MAG: hypothetical protein ACRESZ_18785 [Methylococcales bacterium]
MFRGRYQAILIEPDAYLLNMSRYIHLNPVGAGLVEQASDYPWSSYSAYAGNGSAPEWLHSRFILSMIGQSRQRQRYRSFVEAGMDEETAAFFGKRKRSPILGSDVFRERRVANLEDNPEIPEMRRAVAMPALSHIVTTVAERFSVSEETITRGARGRGKKNPGRTAAIYISRKIAGYPLNEIAAYFGMTHYASASGIVSRCKRAVESDTKLATAIDDIGKKIKSKI